MSYLQKRQHLSAVALGRTMFARVLDMTPARFDILHLVYQKGRGKDLTDTDNWLPLAALRRRLGLRRQTVFQIVERLVELGILQKRPDPDDRRRRILALTDAGIARVHRAYFAAFTEHYPVPRKAGGHEAPRAVYRRVQAEGLGEKKHAQFWAALSRKVPLNPPLRGWFPPLPTAPPKVGREVARVFMTLAWKRAGGRRRDRRLDALDAMLREAHSLAKALGDTSDLIYLPPRPLEPKNPAPTNAS